MRKILILLVLAGSTLLTGCFDIVEEIFLNKDGSGKYHITMDMSGLFSDPMMKGMMEEAIKQQSGDSIATLEKDSIIYFKDLKEAEELSAEEKKTLENLLMRMTMSESKKQMLIRLEYDFKKVEEVQQMNAVLQKVGADKELSGGMPGASLLSGEAASFSWKKGVLKRLPFVMKKAAEEADENMEMMKMFLGDADYKTIYHLPGKVKKADIPNAAINGNTVTVTNGLLDLMDGKVKVEGEIKFK